MIVPKKTLARFIVQTFIFCISWAFGSFLEDAGRAKLEVWVKEEGENRCHDSPHFLVDFHERKYEPEAARP